MRSPQSLPVVDLEPGERTPPRDVVVGAVLLAGGTSSRFGSENKLLADIDGEPMVRRAAETLFAARVDPVVVVLDHDAAAVAAALADQPVRTVTVADETTEQSASIRAGVAAARSNDSDALVIALGDMPYVSPKTIDAIVAAHAAGHGDALAAAYDGVRGNPVLFDRRHFDALEDLAGDRGARRILLEGDSSALVNVGDPGVLRDVDRPATLRSARDYSSR